MNGAPKNLRIAPAGSTNGAKVDPNDPQVRKLVYNAYREMLSKKHADANVIVDNAPQELVTKDQGVGSRVESMMRQQSELKGGNMNAGGPPPPPPPPPIPGVIPSSRLPSEIPNRPVAMNQPPAALAGAMMKDRKPFTYTPGGLDLSEIRSPRMQRRLQKNAQSEGVKPSPLAQQPQQGPPDAAYASQSASQGRGIQVLPMPGVGMGPQQQQQQHSQPKEIPKPVKKSVCGPAPPPPPFVVSSDNSFTMPVSSPPSSIPSTISSPPISSSPTSPAAPQPQLAKEPGPSSIPVAPPLPPLNFAARRGSLFSASSPPTTSPLVSSVPCEPSPPPLPPPQAVRVPITPPITIQDSVPTSVQAASEPVIQSPQTITPPAEVTPLSKVIASQNVVPPSIEDDYDLPKLPVFPQLPQSTSTPIESLITKELEPAHVSPPAPLLNSVHVKSPVLQEHTEELSHVLPTFLKELTPVEQVPIKEPTPSPQMTSREPSVDTQIPIIEPSPSRQVFIRDPSPVSVPTTYEPPPAILDQETIKEPSPVQQTAVKEPSPIRQALHIRPSPVKEPSIVKQVPSKEPTPVQQVLSKEPSPMKPQQLSDLSSIKQVPLIKPMPNEPPENEPPIIFSPIPVKEMPLKEPTPVRQIVREPTPVRQATLEKPVISEPAPVTPPTVQMVGPTKQAPLQQPNIAKQIPTTGTSVLRQAPLQQAGIKRQSSLPEPPFATNVPIQQPTVINQTSNQQPAPVNQSTTQKPNLSKQTYVSQPLPVKSVPVKINSEPVTHSIPVQMPSPPPVLAAASAPTSAKGTRLVRQASLPTKPSSPQFSPPNAQLGSIYIPPLTGEEVNNIGPMSPSAERSPRRSPTTGLHRAPLPWMFRHQRESSPPMFVQHAQQTLNRFQPHHRRFIRQSSLGPESSPTEHAAPCAMMAQPNNCLNSGFQRQQSLPPPQRTHQQPQPVRIQQQYKVEPQQQQQPQLQQQQPQPQQQQYHPQQSQPQQQQYQSHQTQPQQQRYHPQQPQHQQSQPQPQPQPQQQQYYPQQPQPQTQPIKIQQPQAQQNRQTRTIPIQVQQSQQPKHKPRERIIPIMIESDSPPRESVPASAPTATSSSAANAPLNERFIPIRVDGNAASNSTQHSFQPPQSHIHQQQPPLHQPQPTWTNSPRMNFNHPATTLSGGQSGAFLPYNSSPSSSMENSSNINPLDALHQMQQSLAQLNSGLENAFPRFIQKKMSDTITPRTTPSNQYQPNHNGDNIDQGPNSADFGVPVQSRSFRVLQNVLDHHDTAGSDDEISNYMRPIVPQAQTSVSQGGLQSQQPIYNQTQYHPQQISEQGQSANQAQSQNQPQYPMSGMHSTQNDNMPKSKEGPTTSRFFRMLQTITDTLPDGAEPQGPIHIPNMRPAQQHSQHQPQPNQYQQQPPQPLYQHQSGVNNAASTEQTVPEPKKYMGSNIPSRSFRMLQAMTGSDDVAGPGQSDL